MFGLQYIDADRENYGLLQEAQGIERLGRCFINLCFCIKHFIFYLKLCVFVPLSLCAFALMDY
jgi:hypothetical protein